MQLTSQPLPALSATRLVVLALVLVLVSLALITGGGPPFD